MSYLIYKTDGDLLSRVFDGQTDSPTSPTGSSSITLIGKEVDNYGKIQNENFVHIMENFSSVNSPAFPIEGQLWWNKDTNVMSAFDGTAWYPVTGFTHSATTPTNVRSGDQWWDSTNKQYKIYDGADWVVVGPVYSFLDGKSGALVEHVYDSVTFEKHSIIKLYTNGNVIGIMSNVASFTPNVAIEGFTTINPGMTFSSSIDAVKLYGTATNADLLGNLTPSQFLRSDIDTVNSANLSIRNSAKVGANEELELSASNGNALITSNTVNKNIVLKVNVAGTLTKALIVDGSTGLVSVYSDPSTDLGVATKGYVDAGISSLNAGLTQALNANVLTLNNTITANTIELQSGLDSANVQIDLKAPINSPSFTGIPTAITPTDGDSSTKLATTQFIANAISAFDTTRIYNDTTSVKVNVDSISLTVSGTEMVTIDTTAMKTNTQAANDNSTKIATTAYVDRAIKNYVLNSVSYAPTVYISSAPPSNGTGVDGDIWFQYQG